MTTDHDVRESAGAFIQALAATLDDLAESDTQLGSMAVRMAQLDLSAAIRGPFDKTDHDGLRHLERLTQSMNQAGYHAQTGLGDAINAAIQHLDWSPVYGGADTDHALANGLFTAQAAGNYGGFYSDGISVGLFLLAPHLHYPFHTHEAAEVYYCLAGQVEVQQGVRGQARLLEPGDHSFTPPNRLHALTTGDEPALLAYSWHGDLHCETWWWAVQPDGSYRRTAWRRDPGQSWRPHQSEVVSEQAFAQAHGTIDPRLLDSDLPVIPG
ncbi:MAG: dimethylsulfonioproprionate lyase family protein [Pseudomonadota bacterium]